MFSYVFNWLGFCCWGIFYFVGLELSLFVQTGLKFRTVLSQPPSCQGYMLSCLLCKLLEIQSWWVGAFLASVCFKLWSKQAALILTRSLTAQVFPCFPIHCVESILDATVRKCRASWIWVGSLDSRQEDALVLKFWKFSFSMYISRVLVCFFDS